MAQIRSEYRLIQVTCRRLGIEGPRRVGGFAQSVEDLEVENTKLRGMYAELALENAAIRDVFRRES